MSTKGLSPAPIPPRQEASVSPELVHRWREHGDISPSQEVLLNNALREYLAQHPDAVEGMQDEVKDKARQVRSIVVEALGYLGGVIILIALGLLLGTLWDSMTPGQRLGVGATGVIILILGGLAVPPTRHQATDRLRSVLWAGAALAFGGVGAVWAADFLQAEGEAVFFTACAASAALGALLWYAERRPLQHAVMFASLVGLTGVGTYLVVQPVFVEGQLSTPEVLPGLTIWGLGFIWVVLSLAKLVRPMELGTVLGSIALISGSMSCAELDWGIALALVSVAVLIGSAVYVRNLGMLIVGCIGVIQVIPMTLTRFFPGQLSIALVLFMIGLVLVALAVVVAKRGAMHQSSRSERTLPATWAVAGAVAIGVTVALIVLMVR